MVKSYFRHGGTEVFGLITSNTSNSLFDGKKAYVPALEDVYVWDVKRGEQSAMWHATGHVHPVTFISASPSHPDNFAVGYQDGSIRIWSAQSKSELCVLEGHRRGISFLQWDRDGTRLASGAVDGEIILWDVAGESGLFKLRGHNNRINGLVFLTGSSLESDPSSSTALSPPSTHLLSTSQDTYLKLWDLQTQHTIESIVAHRTESWSLTVIPPSLHAIQETTAENEDTLFLLITTGGDGEAKLWTLPTRTLIKGPERDSDGQGFKRAITHVGNVALNTSGAHGKRVLGAVAHPFTLRGGASGIAIAFQVGDRSIEIWRLRTDKEVHKQARRKKKDASKNNKPTEQKDQVDANPSSNWLNRLCPWIMFRGSAKVSSFAFPSSSSSLLAVSERPAELQILLALSNNSIEVLSVPRPTTSANWVSLEAVSLYKVVLPGHRSDIRTLFLSFDDQLLASGSNGSLKVWNLKTQKCIRTLESGYALCGTWLPGNKHILVGTKGGQLMLYELSSCTLLQSCDAHTGAIWSLDLRPDGKGFVTGSADKSVKFWNFTTKTNTLDASEKSEPEAVSATQKLLSLSMIHSKTMKMSDDVLGVRYSPDFKFLAVSTLDATVKIFFQDTLKFFLSLYGHKLPVLDMDISFDSKLVVTCSADKNVKIWGLDFGDCHKSIFAHEESVMQVAFESGSHHFWTVGRDKLVKYWDGDKFENIQTLSGHHKEVSSLAVSNSGQFLVTGSFDKSIRIWEKVEDLLFLEEEREKELERLYNEEDNHQFDLMATRKQKRNEQENDNEQAGAVVKETAETQMSGEKIIEALNLAAQDFESLEKYHSVKASMKDPAMAQKLAPPARSPLFVAHGNISAHAYVLRVIEKIRRPALEDALLVLPFAQVAMLLAHIDHWILQGWSGPLVCRILFFVLRTHESQITATGSLKVLIHSIQSNLAKLLTKQREMIGYNVEAIKFLNQTLETQQQGKRFYDMDLQPVDEIRGMIGNMKKKRKVVI